MPIPSQFPLREYQGEIIHQSREAVRQGAKNVLIASPCGSGKTRTGAAIVDMAAERGKRVLWVAHRDYLIEQAYDTLRQYGVQPGVILGGIAPSSSRPVQVASFQSMVNRLDKYAAFDLVVIDECHLSGAASYRKIINHYPNAHVIGLSATPARADKTLGDIYDVLIHGPQVLDLVEWGNLVPARYVGAPRLEMEGVRIGRDGDYLKADLIESQRRQQISGMPVDTWMEHARGMQTIGFSVGVEASRKLAEDYQKAGVKALHLDGDMKKEYRKAALKAFANKEITYISNCGLFAEGLDIVGVECVQILRPSLSKVFNTQAPGRCIRPSPATGKEFGLILDHTGIEAEFNIMHPTIWTLEKSRKKKAVKRELSEEDIKEIKEAETREIYIDELVKLVAFDSDYTQEWVTTLRQLVKQAIDSNYKKGWIAMQFLKRYPMAELEHLKMVAKVCGYHHMWARRMYDELRKVAA